MIRFLLALVLGAAPAAAELPVRVAVLDAGDSAAAPLIARQLGRLESVTVLSEKVTLHSDRNLTDEDRRALAAGRAALVLLLDRKGDAFAYIDGVTGEELFRIREDTPEHLARSAFLLVEELRDAERAEAQKKPAAP